ncbi:hypothetical protein QTP70_024570 [Hemibagrus guttatus]|uniref:SH3 domain-containing protein n=1 Tax=Hemibagrus guttatus TaxID=175788 RepID=A0AAE0QZP3_9TELE|nr:hypothetical protein QTP70_024570 [Hemibagrus guttatus]
MCENSLGSPGQLAEILRNEKEFQELLSLACQGGAGKVFGPNAKLGLRCKACKMGIHHKCLNRVGQQRCMGKLPKGFRRYSSSPLLIQEQFGCIKEVMPIACGSKVDPVYEALRFGTSLAQKTKRASGSDSPPRNSTSDLAQVPEEAAHCSHAQLTRKHSDNVFTSLENGTETFHTGEKKPEDSQVGCELEEKERFWSELDEVMESIPTGERVVIGADFNGHVGEGNTGDEEVMGKFGVKERNLEGQMVVDFAKRMDMGVVNTYFQKREEHRVTYKSGGRRTQYQTDEDEDVQKDILPLNTYVALYRFIPQENQDLELRPGDRIILADDSNEDWWKGMIEDRIGFFPASYAQLVKEGDRVFRCNRTFIGCKEQGQITIKEGQICVSGEDEKNGFILVASGKKQGFVPCDVLEDI